MAAHAAELLQETRRIACINDLGTFVRGAWHLVEPSVQLRWYWYLADLCYVLQSVSDGTHPTRHVLINLPTRHLKSVIVSVLWPCWEWLRWPWLKQLTASYDEGLAVRDAVSARRVMSSAWYRWLLGAEAWEFAGDQNVKHYYQNNRGGERHAISRGARGPRGFGGNRLSGDDLHSAKDDQNPEALVGTADWYDKHFKGRVQDASTVARVISGQRVAMGDISDHVLEDDPRFDHIVFPFEYDPELAHPASMLGLSDRRTQPGMLLAPGRWPMDEVAAIKRRPDLYWSQYQQQPKPQSGGLFAKGDFDLYSVLPGTVDRWAISADLSFKGDSGTASATERSYVVVQVWAFRGTVDAYLVDEIRGRFDFVQSVQALLDMIKRYPQATARLVEDKANGPALESVLRGKIAGLTMVSPQGSKVERSYAILPFVKTKNIHAPDPKIAPWMGGVGGWLDEVCSFPRARHDDRVDTMTQAVRWAGIGRAPVLVWA